MAALVRGEIGFEFKALNGVHKMVLNKKMAEEMIFALQEGLRLQAEMEEAWERFGENEEGMKQVEELLELLK